MKVKIIRVGKEVVEVNDLLEYINRTHVDIIAVVTAVDEHCIILHDLCSGAHYNYKSIDELLGCWRKTNKTIEISNN